MSKYTSEINRVGQHDGYTWGVRFVICVNDEVLAKPLGLNGDEPDLKEITREAYYAIVREIDHVSGYAFDTERSFKAYNGGPRTAPVDSIWYRSPIFEDDGPPEWERVWFAGAGAVERPPEIGAKVDEIIGTAEQAARDRVTEIFADGHGFQPE